MHRLIFIFWIMALDAQAQQTNFEQTAFDFFATEILTQNYPNSKIYHSEQTESEKSIAGPFANCFQTDSNFNQFFYQQKKSESEKLSIASGNFQRMKTASKTKAKQLNLKIYRAVTNGEIVYVYIKVFKTKCFVDHYLIKISSNKVVDVCHSNEVM